jgi:hypothetical protein
MFKLDKIERRSVRYLEIQACSLCMEIAVLSHRGPNQRSNCSSSGWRLCRENREQSWKLEGMMVLFAAFITAPNASFTARAASTNLSFQAAAAPLGGRAAASTTQAIAAIARPNQSRRVLASTPTPTPKRSRKRSHSGLPLPPLHLNAGVEAKAKVKVNVNLTQPPSLPQQPLLKSPRALRLE